MKRATLLLLTGLLAGTAAAAPTESQPSGTTTTPAVSASDIAAVTSPINPLTGEPVSAETLARVLKVRTLQADIAAQDLKRVQAERQIASPAAAPAAPHPTAAAVQSAKAAPTDAGRKKKNHAKAHAEPVTPPPVVATSPVAGILTENGVRYALLQIGGQGKMARAGDHFMGHRVDAITADTVTLDGRVFRPDQAISTIADSDPPPTTPAAGAPGGPRPNFPPLARPLPSLSTVLGAH